jgi:hypothetical protein
VQHKVPSTTAKDRSVPHIKCRHYRKLGASACYKYSLNMISKPFSIIANVDPTDLFQVADVRRSSELCTSFLQIFNRYLDRFWKRVRLVSSANKSVL